VLGRLPFNWGMSAHHLLRAAVVVHARYHAARAVREKAFPSNDLAAFFARLDQANLVANGLRPRRSNFLRTSTCTS